MRVLPSFVGRAAVLWLLVRVALLAVTSAGAGLPGDATSAASRLVLAPPAMPFAALAVTALLYVDMAALHERAFMANLGVDRRLIGIAAFVTALTLETAVAAAASILA